MFKRKKRRSREFKDTSRVIDMAEARESRRRRREEATEKKTKSKKAKNEITERKATQMARRKLIYTVIFLVIITVIGMSAYNVISLKMNEAELKTEKKALENKREKLQYELTQLNSAEYIEQQARQTLRMVKPGEILYVLPDKEKNSKDSKIVPDNK